ncbi:hypothetical protein BN1095_4130001 [Clostridioides difficile]|uniref:Uncharacterized protein n=1 Tax=Clostridioides difficile TaxID=1496 RepID=A0A069APK2_CLODI|nr:hypothetical protein BN1095_4130001 [Clostridioides difficile]
MFGKRGGWCEAGLSAYLPERQGGEVGFGQAGAVRAGAVDDVCGGKYAVACLQSTFPRRGKCRLTVCLRVVQ